ncbi:NADPH-dependent cytochrome P450 oxidoreductase [Pilobolus umbonatus]|nr:NADPH-dependent cytochrome P450 oxidoreductase [Pilobolus umbonatus]
MESPHGTTLFDTTDLIIMALLGLGTAAWFSRKQLYTLVNQKAEETKPITTVSKPKRERNFVKIMKKQGKKVIVFYGSQTGTAEGYAARIAKESSQRYGVSTMTADLELYDLTYLDQVPSDCLVIFVLATYGEGEPTDNAAEFWDLITEEDPIFSENNEEKPLSNLRYILFGLGNRTYDQYNEVSRRVDTQLTRLGAHRIGERGEGDDDGSMEEDYLSWKDTMWPAFCQALGIDENSVGSIRREPLYVVNELTNYKEEDVYQGELSLKVKNGAKVVYDAKRPYIAPIVTRELFNDSDRHCIHVDIDISNTNLSYNTGDHVAIWPTNNEHEVIRLASILGLHNKLDSVIEVSAIDPTASKKHPFPVPTTYRAIFRHYLEIAAPVSRQTLGSLVEFAPNESIKAALMRFASDKDVFRIEVGDACRNLGEVLELVSSSDARPGLFSSVPFDVIIENIARMQPRFYSISSSAKESPHVISATVVTLSYHPETAPHHTVYGVNSNFLYRILQQNGDNAISDPNFPVYDLKGPRNSFLGPDGVCRNLPVHIRHSQFKLPRNPSVPIVMIGPGTGVAPFRGFIRERVFEKKRGKTVGSTILFYGSRNEKNDFLYADEWPELFETLGPNSRIVTAFSRDQPQKIYVQHRLQEYTSTVWELLQQGGYVYVCGDAKNMARDVNQTFINMAVEVGNMTEAKAHDYIKNLRTTGRYQEDVWS